MRGRSVRAAALLFGAAFLAGCGASGAPGEAPPTPDTTAAPSTPAAVTPAASALDASGLESLQATRVYFAHRSVGADIVDLGIPAVYERFDLTPPTVVAGMPSADGVLGDHWLLQTEDPRTKLEDFAARIRETDEGTAPDIAMMKLGYVDITADTDVPAVFAAYRSTMDDLEAAHPEIAFVHATVTVTTWVPENNAAIERFNALMREQYGTSGRLVDLAGALSTCADGTEERHTTQDGAVYYSLCAEYTRDGGHLNARGAEAAAEELLRVLADVAS